MIQSIKNRLLRVTIMDLAVGRIRKMVLESLVDPSLAPEQEVGRNKLKK